jgi:transcription termination factor NusB
MRQTHYVAQADLKLTDLLFVSSVTGCQLSKLSLILKRILRLGLWEQKQKTHFF